MPLAFSLLILLILIAVNALYVAAEFATVSARRARLSTLADEGSESASQLLPYLDDPKELDRYIAACQVGITLSSLVVGFFGQAQLAPYLGFGLSSGVSAVLVLILLTALQVIFGELFPKSVATRYPERLALLTVKPLVWSLKVLKPLIRVLNGSALWLLDRMGVNKDAKTNAHSPAELELVFHDSMAGGYLDAGEREMLENALKVEQRLARAIMVPRNRMVSVNLATEPSALLSELVKTRHTRFPVFENDIDHIQGFINLRDLYLLVERGGELSEILRELPVLPETNTVTEVWEELKAKSLPLAVLFDEYGGTVGLVTLEDIVEEVVGELQDEFDNEAARFEERAGRVYVRGNVLVARLNSHYLVQLSEDEADTIGGLFIKRLGRAPKPGDELDIEGLTFRLESLEEGAVTKLSFPKPDPDGASA